MPDGIDPYVRSVTFLLDLVCFVLIQSFFVTPTLLLCEISLASFCCSVDTNTLTRAHHTKIDHFLTYAQTPLLRFALQLTSHFSCTCYSLSPRLTRARCLYTVPLFFTHTHTSTHGARFKCVRVGPSHRSRITSHHCREKVNQGLLQ